MQLLSTANAEQLQASKATIRAIRENARTMLAGSATGIQITARISEQIEAFMLERYRAACLALPVTQQRMLANHAAITVVGGSGRGELCPYSDVDLLFLYKPLARDPFASVVAQVIRDGWDAGLKIGHSVRTVDECIAIALTEQQVATSLVELRPLAGDAGLVSRMRSQFADRVVNRRVRAFINDCIVSRQAERQQYGGSPSILEPDVKRAAGGLRDVHLLRWIGFARYQTVDYDSLRLKGALNRDEARRLLEAYEFLSRVRVELHLAAGRESDLLTREEQRRIAAERKTVAPLGMKPVERFMQTYLQHATAIAEIVDRFVTRARPRFWIGALMEKALSRRAAGQFLLSPHSISFLARSRESALRQPEKVLELFRYVSRNGVDPTPETEVLIRNAVLHFPADVSVESTQIFQQILSSEKYLGATLRAMYRTGLLEWLIPDLRHSRCLIQFNQYHTFTVDEHSLRAVEAACSFMSQAGPLGQARAAIRQPATLNLALLLHDAGKGFERDHSEVGREIAMRTALRLKFPEAEKERLELLVQKHLLMAHLAFRRDTTDPAITVQFGKAVSTPETLRMLYILTAADLAAVGPGVWTEWKADLLTGLYEQTMHMVSGHKTWMNEEGIAAIKLQVADAFPHSASEDFRKVLREWAVEQLDSFSHQYLVITPVSRIVADLHSIRTLRPGEAFTAGSYERETRTVEYRVIADAVIAEGSFHKMAGVLSAKRLEVLSAVIETTSDGTVVDSFKVLDPDHEGAVPSWRIAEVTASLREAIRQRPDIPQLFRRNKVYGSDQKTTQLSDLPLHVAIDNQSSEYSTIIDIFAHDRPGLLHMLTRTLYELNLSVELAKISTQLDQVVDVFYVTTREGDKLKDDDELRQIRQTLQQGLEDFENAGHEIYTRDPTVKKTP